MDHRIGECSSCGAVYKLPADFAHDQARCKKCGGVVEIGPSLVSDAAPKREAPAASAPVHKPVPAPAPAKPAPPIPAKKVAAAPPPKKVAPPPAALAAPRKERSGPSMKDQILARKASSEPRIPREPQGANARIVSPPSVQQSQTIGVAGRGAAAHKPHAPGAPAKPARPGAAPARAGGAASAPAVSRRTGPARSRRDAVDEEDGEEEGGRASRRGARGGKKKNASLLPGLVALVVLVVLGVGAWYVNDRMRTEAAAKEEAARAQTPLAPGADAAADAGAGAADPSAAGDAGAADAGAASDGAPDEGAASAPETNEPAAGAPDAAAPGAAADAGAKPADGPKPEKRAAGDPDSIDLAAIADFEAVKGVSEERWTELRQLAAAVADPLSGAAGNRAKLQLEQAGKEAFPALLNVFKRLDLTTEDGFRSADVVQKTLEKICNGNNYGWLYKHQENWLYYDKKAIQSWCTKWDQVKDDEAGWLKLTKQDKPAKEEPEGAKDDEPIIGDDFDIEDG